MSACQAVIADFAWWSQTCNEPAVGTVTVYGDKYAVCAEHWGGEPA